MHTPSILTIILAGIWDYNFGEAQEGWDHRNESVVLSVFSGGDLIFFSFCDFFTQSSENFWPEVNDKK